MAKELVINQNFNEVRAALIGNGEILDYLIERDDGENLTKPRVGNIYLGRVIRVIPGMQSAFVDIGQERAAFLYVDDAYLPSLKKQREMLSKLDEDRQVGQNQEKNKSGKVIPDELSTLSETVSMRFKSEGSIETFLSEGDEILVQISKEPISTKGPRITRQITLAGRHIVFMPFIEHTGVSRRIENNGERDRLKEILESIKADGRGIIARTVAEGQSYKVLKADYNMLVKMWKEIQKKSDRSKVKAPSLIHNDLTFVQRILRDITDEDVANIIVDDKNNLKQVDKFIAKFLPSMKGKTKFYSGASPIFEHYGIEIEIERALGNKVFLKSGGSINIDQTEALVSVDVNTGKFVGRKNLEDTILQTNLEAVKEISYQLRLRNCGGLVIIDFIDMEKENSRDTVYQALLECLKKDRAKTNVLPISSLGLVEMTRKRTRDTLSRIMADICPYCEGTGRVKSSLTMCYEIIRELIKTLKKNKCRRIYVYAHPEVSAQLCSEDMYMMESIEELYSVDVVIRSENNYHIEQYEIYPQGKTG